MGEAGEGELTVYEFAPKKLAHKFCPTCGVAVLAYRYGASPGEDVSVNIRTLRDVDLWALEVETCVLASPFLLVPGC